MAAVRAVTAPARVVTRDPQRFSLAAQAWLDEMVAGEDLAGGADRVEGVAFAAAASWWAFGSAHLDDAFPADGQEFGQSGAVTVGSFHRPAACAG